MTALDDLKAYDFANSVVSLWTFKKRVADGVPAFKGRWLETTVDLDASAKEVALANRACIEETQDFGLLTENHSTSALVISTDETHVDLMLDEMAAEENGNRADRLNKVKNSDFYAFKFVIDDEVIVAVKKVDQSWQTKKSNGLIPVVFQDQILDITQSPHLTISKSVDFFIVGQDILIRQKSKFESILSYRLAHVQDFGELQQEPEFLEIFTSLDPLLEYVGSNKIHLRRMCIVRQKAHYKDADFLENLRNRAAELNLGIEFDDQGKIVPSPESCREIIQALLDHRLSSRLSSGIYDVADSTRVA